jgi:hypothetical protein
LSVLVAEISRELLGEPVTYTDDELMEILSPRPFVNVRRTHGGPAPEDMPTPTPHPGGPPAPVA